MNPTPFQKPLAFLDGGGEMGERIRAFDWSQTPLGPAASWPSALRTVVQLMLANRLPMLLWWGPDYISIYNDPYRPVLGNKHPWGLGLPVRECWQEIWDVLRPLIDVPFQGGPATWNEDILLVINRYGFEEETHWLIAYSPVPDESAPGGIGGVLATVHEVTEKVVNERRLAALRDLGLRFADVKTAEAACAVAAKTLEAYDRDIPFALLYLNDGNEARLAGATGVTESPLRDGPWPFADLRQATQPQVVADLAARFSKVPQGPWPDPPDKAVIVPIASSKPGEHAGFLVAGVSSRLKLDDSYLGFFDLVATRIGTAIANARAYDAEKKRAEGLADLDRAKTAFFSNVSHEFRTPLTLMLGPVEDALSGELAPETRERLEFVHRNGLRLERLVNTLLDFSRIEAGRVEATYAPTDLAAFTADLASNFRSACDRAWLALRVECPALGEPVFVDRPMWEKIVLNLLSNAFKFTFDGGIEVSLRKTAHAAELEVRDTGTGIPAEEMPHLFDRFHRVENARGRTHEGSGIGLAFVQELVKLHGGAITAESEMGKGTTFRVSIPFGSSHLPPDRVAEGETLAVTTARTDSFVEEVLSWIPETEPAAIEDESPEPVVGLPRILVADDNADMRRYVVRLLGGQYSVVAVPDGAAALAAVQKEAPDLVLSDVMMPKLDGFGLLKELRADPRTAGTPVVLLSARAGEESRVEGMQAGADDYLVKPFSARELRARVSAHLQMARLRREANESLRASEERLAAELEATRRLHAVSSRLLAADDLKSALDDLLRNAIETCGADMGAIQLVSDQARALEMIVHRGFKADFLEQFRVVRPEEGSACARAMKTGVRIMIEDITLDPEYEQHLGIAASAGYRSVQSTPLRTHGGEIIGMLSTHFARPHRLSERDGVLLDLYARHAADLIDRMRYEDALKEADRRKDEFLATLAHELRNPLAPIRNAVHVLRLKEPHEPNLRWARDVIDRQVDHLTRLIDDLLDLARITRNKLELSMQPVELGEVLAGALEASRPIIAQYEHELTTTLPEEPILLHADLVRLTQVFLNLLTNAAKYTERGGHIELSAVREGPDVVVSVKDDGVGIPKEKLPRLFDMFYQVDASLEKAQGGLGIGLSLVRRLVDLHDGKVEARSDGAGKGSTFLVRLPVLVAAPSTVSEEAPKPHIKPLARRILVVDDNRDAADSLATFLRLSGNHVDIAYDGRSGIEAAERARPEVVLIDIGMPNVNGYDACRHLRSQPWGRNLLLVALTGWGRTADKSRTMEAGFDAHLVKPVDPAALLKLLAEQPAI